MRDAHFLADEQLGAELEQQLVEKVIQQAVEIMARDRDRHQVLGTEIDRSKIGHVAEHADCLLLKGLSERAPPYMTQQAAQSARVSGTATKLVRRKRGAHTRVHLHVLWSTIRYRIGGGDVSFVAQSSKQAAMSHEPRCDRDLHRREGVNINKERAHNQC